MFGYCYVKRSPELIRLILSCMGSHTYISPNWILQVAVCDCVLYHVCIYCICLFYIYSFITLHTEHVQYLTEITLSTCITRFHISLPASAFQQSPVLYGFTFLMINQTISPDYDAAHIIIAPASVVIVAFPLCYHYRSGSRCVQ